MTLNTMLYSYVREGEVENMMSLNDFSAEVERAYEELESDVIEVKQQFAKQTVYDLGTEDCIAVV